MRVFNYSAIREQKWDSEILGLIAAIYKEAGKQELYLKRRPEELEKLVEIAKIKVQRHPMRLKASLPPIPESGGLSKKKPLPRTETSRKLRDTVMCFRLFTKALMPFP